MPWGRLDDSLYDHPKVEDLPDRLRNACVGLWARAISWSNRYLTDGFVPDSKLRRLDAKPAEVDALIEVGLFERGVDGVTVHDFLDFNDSAEAVRKRRTEMRELGRSGGKRSGEARRFAKSNRDGSSVDEPARLNSRPVPSESRPVPSASARGAVPDDEGGYETVVAWLAARGAWVDSPKIQTDLARMVDRKGAPVVIAAMAAVPDAEEAAQFVYGARNALFPLAPPKVLTKDERDRAEARRELGLA